MLDHQFLHRINLINNFDYESHRALVKTSICINQDLLIYTQNQVQIEKKVLFKKKDFYSLVEALKYFEKINFVHGDLNRKNILWTPDGFNIIDYEPSLIQKKNGLEQLIITLPYVFKQELIEKKITQNTDKLSFFYFILRVTGFLRSKNIVDLSKTLDHCNLYGLTYSKIQNMKYDEILDFAFAYRERQRC